MLVHLALLWHDGKAAEAVRPKRLSVSNFASGWILLIYVGKESQSAAISPEMPWQVNCILPLVTDSTFTIMCIHASTRAQARTHTYTQKSTLFSSGMINTFWFIQLKVSSLRQASSQNQTDIVVGEQIQSDCREIITQTHTLSHILSYRCTCVLTGRITGWLSNEKTTDTEILPSTSFSHLTLHPHVSLRGPCWCSFWVTEMWPHWSDVSPTEGCL